MAKWLHILAELGPALLLFTPAAPIAPFVVGAISLAEQIPGATGAQKKSIAIQIAAIGAQATNTMKGTIVLDPSLVSDAADKSIDAVVTVVNALHKVQPAV